MKEVRNLSAAEVLYQSERYPHDGRMLELAAGGTASALLDYIERRNEIISAPRLQAQMAILAWCQAELRNSRRRDSFILAAAGLLIALAAIAEVLIYRG